MKGIKGLLPKLSYVIYFIAFIVAIGYLVKNEYMAIASLIGLSAISYYFIKKCAYSLLIGILGSLIVVNFRAGGREGFTGKDYTSHLYPDIESETSINMDSNDKTITLTYNIPDNIGIDCSYLDNVDKIDQTKCYFSIDPSNIQGYQMTINKNSVEMTKTLTTDSITMSSSPTISITKYIPKTKTNTNTKTTKSKK